MDNDFKQKELEVRSQEAENRKTELLMQKDRQDAEIQGRKRMTEFMIKFMERKFNEN